MSHFNITFIGAGNMATALIGGLLQDKFPAQQICATDVNDNQLTHLEQVYGIKTSCDNKSAITDADVVVLSVKPQIIDDVCRDIASVAQHKKKLFISIAAGATVNKLSHLLGETVSIVRAMPNTPALIKAGATGLFANEYVTQAQKEIAEKLMRAVGIVVWVEQESQMDVVTALSGSGPAYFFKIMESLEQAACQMGLPPQTAHLLTLQTALGAARLAMESDDTLATLREKVTSPGGTTARGLETMQQANIEEVFLKTIQAATERAVELGAK